MTSVPDRSDYATPEEAKAMFDKAVSALKRDPKDALARFNDEHGEFRDRDLYVFCFEMSSGKMTAAYNRSLLGVDIRTLRVCLICGQAFTTDRRLTARNAWKTACQTLVHC